MKNSKIVSLITVILSVITISACGASGSVAYDGAKVGSEAEEFYAETTAAWSSAEDAYYGGGYTENTIEESDTATAAKIIHTAYVEMQSTEFEAALENIDSQVAAIDGAYFENRAVSSASRNYKYANMTIRVPVKNLGDFVSALHGIATITNETQTADDVSEYYYDTESRLNTAKTKLARLQELLKEAKDIEDIITIESSISDVEYEIDELQGTLKHYDSKIEYSTVTVQLSEVKEVENPELPKTFGDRLKEAFNNGIKGFLNAMKDVAVWFAESWSALLLLFIIFVLPAIIIIKTVKRRRKRKLEIIKNASTEKSEEKTKEVK